MTRKQCFKTLQQGMTLLELSVVLLVLTALAGLAVPYVGGIGSTAMCQTTDATMQAVKEAIMGGKGGAGFYGDMLGQLPHDRYFATGYGLNYLFTRDDGLDNDGDSNPPSSDGKTNVDPDDEWRAYNAKTGVGWRGPYLQSGGVLSSESIVSLDNSFDSYNATTNPNGKAHINHRSATVTQVFDAWRRPIILQVPATCSMSTDPSDCARLVSAGSGSGLAPGDAIIDTSITDEAASSRNDDRVLFLKIPDPRAGANIPCDES